MNEKNNQTTPVAPSEDPMKLDNAPPSIETVMKLYARYYDLAKLVPKPSTAPRATAYATTTIVAAVE